MEDEHFGITIVEMMVEIINSLIIKAAGLITLAHNSAGAKYDIIKEEEDISKLSGFLCKNENSFSEAAIHALLLTKFIYLFWNFW